MVSAVQARCAVVNIEEIKQKRAELREQIYQLLNQFELSTGCEVTAIDLERMEQTMARQRGRVVVRLQVVLP